MLTWIAVALLGGAGAVLRAVIGHSAGIPAVNFSGAFALGILSGAGLTHDATLLAGTALIGSYTTFSTWMLEAHVQRTQSRYALMWLNLLGCLAVGLGAAALGRAIA